MSDAGDHDGRPDDDRSAVALRIDYDDADDLLADYTHNLSQSGVCISSNRALSVGTEIRLALSFPGLVEPIRVRALVTWTRGGSEPVIGVEFADPATHAELAAFIARVRDGDPSLVRRALRVLVVEDNKHVAELLRLAFDHKNVGTEVAIDCWFAGDGGAALQLLQHNRFDAMICDVYLPVLDGPKLIATVRGELASKLPIIAVSAGGDSAKRAAMAAGADIFIDKPMRLRKVIETMRSIIDREAVR